MKKLVVFDLDGTLADSLVSLQYCTNYAIASCGFKPIPLEPYKYFAGDGAEMLLRRALAYSGDIDAVNLEKVFAVYNVFFEENCMYEVKPYEGMAACLDTLKKNGIKIAVFSNKPHARTVDVVETLFGKDYFDEIVGQGDLVPKKPCPDGVHLLAKKFGLSLEDIVYVGDTDTDMQTGKAAGVFTIGALWGFRDKEELEKNHADVVIDTPMDILTQVI